ncbi:polysaccharide deacetylase family protein [Bacillus spongiae]|uniref:Polysaccharide deacetylase family protein n=1 Tax=Bacillus spongiae TaxID=2683610 RepID=A0ABU8H8E3_9BACI
MRRKRSTHKFPKPNARFYTLIVAVAIAIFTFNYISTENNRTEAGETTTTKAEEVVKSTKNEKEKTVSEQENSEVDQENSSSEDEGGIDIEPTVEDNPSLPENDILDQTKGKVAYITVDDGPSAYTESFIDLFEKHNVKATFFMLGPSIERYPNSVKEMSEKGFGIGLHGISHDSKKIYDSLSNVLGEMDAEREIVQRITGTDTQIIRTPYGSRPFLSAEWKKSIQAEGYKIWDWNVDSEDWKYPNRTMVDIVISSVQELEAEQQNPVILFHDSKATLEQMEDVITFLLEEGYELKAIDDSLPALTW